MVFFFCGASLSFSLLHSFSIAILGPTPFFTIITVLRWDRCRYHDAWAQRVLRRGPMDGGHGRVPRPVWRSVSSKILQARAPVLGAGSGEKNEYPPSFSPSSGFFLSRCEYLVARYAVICWRESPNLCLFWTSSSPSSLPIAERKDTTGKPPSQTTWLY